MMKITRKHTVIVLISSILGLIGWEFMTIAFGEDATISEVVWQFLDSNPFRFVVVLLVGMLGGHLLWWRNK